MKLYVQFMIILVFSFLGKLFRLFFIFLFRKYHWLNPPIFSPRVQIDSSSPHSYGWKFLLANMTILFACAVGIMERFDAIKDYLLPIIIVILGAIF